MLTSCQQNITYHLPNLKPETLNLIRIQTTVILTSASIVLVAQSRKIDSLQSLLSESEGIEKISLLNTIAEALPTSDSAKILSYVAESATLSKELKYTIGEIEASYALGWYYARSSKFEKAINLAKTSLKKAESVNYRYGVGKHNTLIGVSLERQGKYKEALYYDSLSLFIGHEVQDTALISSSLNNLGSAFESQGLYEKSLEAYVQSLELAENGRNEELESAVSNNIAGLYTNMGDLEKGLEFFFKSLAIDERVGNEEGLGQTLLNISLVYYYMENLEESLKNLKKAATMMMKIKSQLSLAYAYNGLGTIYSEMEEQDSALSYLLKAVVLGEELGIKSELSRSYSLVGLIYDSRGDANGAIEYGIKSLSLAEDIGNPEDIAVSNINLGKIYFKHGKILMARKHIQAGTTIGENIGFAIAVRDGLEQLARIEAFLGNHKKAYVAYVSFKEIADSLNSQENTRKVTRLEADFEFQKERDSVRFENEMQLLAKNQEIQLLEEQKKVSRLFWLLSIIVVLVILAVFFFVTRTRVRLKTQEAQKLKEIGEFKEAMTGMIVHDLKNPLAVIMGMESEQSKTQSMARQMLVLVNNMLDVQKFEKKEIKLNIKSVNLLSLVAESIDHIASLAEKKNLQIETEIAAALVVEVDADYIQRVFINFLTNAIKYSPQNEKIHLMATSQDRMVQVMIVDHGKGIAPQDQVHIFEPYEQIDPQQSGMNISTGLGLAFCQMVLRAHGTEIIIDSELGKGSTFSFQLPLSTASFGAVKQSEEKLVLTDEEKRFVLSAIPKLRALELYQAVEIEEALEPMSQSDSKAIEKWVNAVLAAAYAGNQSHYEELMAEIEG